MLETLIAAWKLPDLRQRILFVFGAFAVYTVGLHIPVPGIDHAKMEQLFSQMGGVFGLVDVFSGGALRKFTIFAMGIVPYINASIIMQLLVAAIPQWKELQKEGETGRKEIAKRTRYLTVALAFLQSLGISITLVRSQILTANWWQLMVTAIVLTAGTMFLLWLGEQITDKGVGNGVSLIIFASITASLPWQISKVWEAVAPLQAWMSLILLVVVFLGTIVGIVYVTQAQRKIPIQHARRIVGMRQVGGHSSFLPLKIAMAGVIPIIFAISLMLLPMTIVTAIPAVANAASPEAGFPYYVRVAAQWLAPGDNALALLMYAIVIVIFTYFYTAVQFDVNDMADNLKKYGSYIPGIRPGKPTADYLDKVVSRITFAGALFLAAVAIIQYIAPAFTGVDIGTFSLVGGTSLLIVVGVALDTMQSIEAQMLMRNYEGFLRE
ncbi:MAG: preprotein translocase subunit SecY [Armatimonadota bacterium]|nr:preprotein translocase subunit SecY [bacterium]MDW8320071.1 preprotein translocase subunit SecY [Armatimonadota bacterium]